MTHFPNLRHGLYAILILLFVGCSTTYQTGNKFSYSGNDNNHPWTHTQFDDDPEKFTFAIISDLWGGERPGIIEVALEQLNLLRPEFVMSVGDLIDGGNEDRERLTKEWDAFDKKVADLHAPFFHVGGNHDLTNVTMRDVWADRYGDRYYHFIYKDVLFLILDSEDYDEERMQKIYEARAIAIEILDGDEPAKAVTSEYFQMPERRTGEISDEQKAYFEKIIEEHSNVRWTFVFMHKPVWMREDMGGLKSIENALAGRPYTVINGHFHTYNYKLKNDRDYITLGTTGGSQNAESDMAFDHLTWVTMTNNGPSISVLKLQGVLDKSGNLPANGDVHCFQASLCKEE